MDKKLAERGFTYLLVFAGLYYVGTFIGFITGVINYGGPANQAFGLGFALVAIVVLIGKKVVRFR